MTEYQKRMYEKLAISLPSHVAETARRAVRRGEAPSLSAYVASAIEEKANEDSLEKLLDEMLAETGGPPTPAERRWARRKLGLEGKRKPTNRKPGRRKAARRKTRR